MTITVTDHPPIRNKLHDLGITLLNGLTIAPSNIEHSSTLGDLRQQVESDTVRTLFNTNKIEYQELFDDDHQPGYLQQYSMEWYGPTLIITAGFLTQNPHALSIATGIITNYLYDLFKTKNSGKASLDLIYEYPDGKCKKIQYCGTPEGLSEVHKIVRDLEGIRE